jgi:hypothetical protein
LYLCSFRRILQSLRRWMRSSRRAHESTSTIIAATVMTRTPLEGAGPVAHGGTTVENLNWLVIHS